MTRDELVEQRNVLKGYLTQKAKAEDWHGVADAAMDLREIDAKLDVLRDTLTMEEWRAGIAPFGNLLPESVQNGNAPRYNARLDRYELADGTPVTAHGK